MKRSASPLSSNQVRAIGWFCAAAYIAALVIVAFKANGI